ncbi:MAG: hypothetical protein K9W44_12535 [Candidatus Lokiarchaeota archaeon]|nr:hypothetical protein [Candidatus Harpocratesius repetitus]
MVDSFELAKLHQKLRSFFQNTLELELIYIFVQNGVVAAKDFQKMLPEKKRFGNPRIYQCLKKLANDGWITQIGVRPLTYAISDNETFRHLLNNEIILTQEHLESQKKNYYDIVTILDKLQSEIGQKSPENSSLPSIPANVSSLISNMIKKIHKFSKLKIFNGEYNITIALNTEKRQFHLNSVEFISEKEEDQVLFGGFFTVKLHPESNMENLIQFIHKYHLESLEFRYKLEKKGYIDGKFRKLENYRFLDDFHLDSISNNENNISKSFQRITSAFQIFISSQKFLGKITTISFIPQKFNKNIKESSELITIWGESKEIFENLKSILFNDVLLI